MNSNKNKFLYTFIYYLEDLKKLLAIIKIGWKQNFTYKINLFFAFVVSIVPLFGFYYLWKTIYVNQILLNNYSFSQMITYIITAFFLYSIITPFGLEWEISAYIFEGNLTQFLLYPYNFIKYCFSLLTAEKTFILLIKIPLIILIYFFTRNEILLPTLFNFMFFLLSILSAYFIYFFIAFIVGISAFWWTDVTGLFYLENTFVSLCSGLLIPLNFFPNYIYTIIKFTPFYYVIFFPTQIFLGNLNYIQIIGGFSFQFLWIIILSKISSIILKAGLVKYEAAGG